jgi:hypothetical protein
MPFGTLTSKRTFNYGRAEARGRGIVTVQLTEYQADLLSRDVEVLEDLIYLGLCPAWWMLFVTTSTGIRVPAKTGAPLCRWGSTSTPGTLDQSMAFFSTTMPL